MGVDRDVEDGLAFWVAPRFVHSPFRDATGPALSPTKAGRPTHRNGMADEKRPDYDIEALIALVRWLNGIDDSKTLARKLADVGEK